jgi:hypothetical protein
MSLWEQYQNEHADDVLIVDVPESMQDALLNWLYDMAKYVNNAHAYAQGIKNKFRISSTIPTRYANNYSDPPEYWMLARFLYNIALSDSQLFFVLIDYMLANSAIRRMHAEPLGLLLDNAGHKYRVQKSHQIYTITERIPAEELKLMETALTGKNIYASEFRDAFKELYGTNPDHTASAGESFQALESALKFYFGEDKGKNLGAILDWLKKNMSAWSYSVAADGQIDAQEHFISLVDFVNKSYRKTKHGQANVKLAAEKEHAETILRVVALLIYELENTIDIPA